MRTHNLSLNHAEISLDAIDFIEQEFMSDDEQEIYSKEAPAAADSAEMLAGEAEALRSAANSIVLRARGNRGHNTSERAEKLLWRVRVRVSRHSADQQCQNSHSFL